MPIQVTVSLTSVCETVLRAPTTTKQKPTINGNNGRRGGAGVAGGAGLAGELQAAQGHCDARFYGLCAVFGTSPAVINRSMRANRASPFPGPVPVSALAAFPVGIVLSALRGHN